MLGFAIAGLHYIAMFATSFAPPGARLELGVPVMVQGTLAYWVAAAVITICLVNFTVVMRAGKSHAWTG